MLSIPNQALFNFTFIDLLVLGLGLRCNHDDVATQEQIRVNIEKAGYFERSRQFSLPTFLLRRALKLAKI